MTVQKTRNRQKTAMGCAIAAIAMVVLLCAVVAGLHFGTDAFVVADGSYWKACIDGWRECAGILGGYAPTPLTPSRSETRTLPT
jgi:hypothetical protein